MDELNQAIAEKQASEESVSSIERSQSVRSKHSKELNRVRKEIEDITNDIKKLEAEQVEYVDTMSKLQNEKLQLQESLDQEIQKSSFILGRMRPVSDEVISHLHANSDQETIDGHEGEAEKKLRHKMIEV